MHTRASTASFSFDGCFHRLRPQSRHISSCSQCSSCWDSNALCVWRQFNWSNLYLKMFHARAERIQWWKINNNTQSRDADDGDRNDGSNSTAIRDDYIAFISFASSSPPRFYVRDSLVHGFMLQIRAIKCVNKFSFALLCVCVFIHSFIDTIYLSNKRSNLIEKDIFSGYSWHSFCVDSRRVRVHFVPLALSFIFPFNWC